MISANRVSIFFNVLAGVFFVTCGFDSVAPWASLIMANSWSIQHMQNNGDLK